MRRHIRPAALRTSLIRPHPSPYIAFAIFIISAQQQQQQGKYSVYFYGSFLFALQLGRLPEKLLAIFIPFDRVESTIAHLVAAEQFGLLCDIDNARDGQAG